MAYVCGVRTRVVTMVDDDSPLLDDNAYEPVIVLPLDQWRRLVHLVLHEESDTRADFDKVEAEVRAIIASVEVPDAV